MSTGGLGENFEYHMFFSNNCQILDIFLIIDKY